ncbi:MAG: tyrosine-type recombinase/integrase [Alphaproteobacteria bacterium]
MATLTTVSTRFSEALSRYDETHCKQNLRPNTARETMRHLKRHFGYLGQKRLEDIQPHDIMHVIDSILSTPATANATFCAIRGFFNWAVRRRYLDRSPCERMTLPTKPKTRDRVLTDDELKAVWNSADYYPFGTLVRLLILTGQRRGEISAMTWPQLGSQTLNFAPEQTKNHRPHEIPIGTLTRRILDEMPRFQSEYVLPARAKPDRPYSGWSKGKRAFDKYCSVQD